MSSRVADVEVLVVGAGLAGLAAADRLAEQGRDVLVLEARDRVGGRTLSIEPVTGAVLDLGAQWVTPPQTALRALVDELSLRLVDMPDAGQLTVLAGGTAMKLSPDVAELDANAAAAVARLDELSADVDPRVPWEHPDAGRLDARTLAAWLDQHVADGAARARLDEAAEGYFATPTCEISLLHALVYARANGGFDHLLGAAGSPATQQRVAQGAQAIALGLAARLGDRVWTEQPVLAIEQDERQVRARCRDATVTARVVVLALPPHLTAAIACAPALPWQRRQLVQRIAMGSGLKANVVYDEPFWRRGGSGQMADVESGLVAFDSSLDGGPGVLVALPTVTESRALAPQSVAARRAAVLDRLVRAFGQPAGSPLYYDDRMWAWEPESDGEVSVFGCGAWSAFGRALRAPVGRLLFAGTETSAEFTGQMEGAVRSGQRAAGEAIELL